MSRKYIRCTDRMCGATDCPNCFPSSYDAEERAEREENCDHTEHDHGIEKAMMRQNILMTGDKLYNDVTRWMEMPEKPEPPQPED